MTEAGPRANARFEDIDALAPGPAIAGPQVLDELTQLGIALKSEYELLPLLERIVHDARRFTRAEAASLFLLEDGQLRSVVALNDVIACWLGEDAMRHRLESLRLRLDVPSLAGYVATTGSVLNVPDAYQIPPGRPYAFNWGMDVVTGYRTRSVLAVPLGDASQPVLGVLELINALDVTGSVIPFHPGLEDAARAFASYAAVAVRGARREELSPKETLADRVARRKPGRSSSPRK